MAARKKEIPNGNSIARNDNEYYCWFELKMKPMPDSHLAKIATELVDWAEKNDKALSISQFYTKRRWAASTWHRWVDRSETLQEAVKVATAIFADRREIGAITGKYNAVTIMPYMSMFKKEYKDHAEWRASLNKDQTNQLQNIKVVIERFPETNVVPTKITDKENET